MIKLRHLKCTYTTLKFFLFQPIHNLPTLKLDFKKMLAWPDEYGHFLGATLSIFWFLAGVTMGLYDGIGSFSVRQARLSRTA